MLGGDIMTRIIGRQEITDINILASFVTRNNKDIKSINEIATAFIEIGKLYGVRGDIAFCQAIIETGWFRFDKGTAVTSDQHNYCGLGVISKGVKGHSFNTVRDGVTAMIQHLYAYATINPIPKGETLINPRFRYVKRGISPTWEGLSNRWAMNANYGKHILSMYEQLKNFKGDREIMTKLIAIDDGHGMETAGKRTPTLPNGQKSKETGKNFMHENEFNRAVAKYLKIELERNGFRTIMVAPTDADTPLATRVATANNAKADLYVSIHANANTAQWGDWGGIETFTYKLQGESYRIGKLIHDEVVKGTALRNRGVKDGSHLYVVRNTTMPAVLVEYGFMDSKTDYKYLLEDAYRKECAVETAIGICKAYSITYKPEKQEDIKDIIKEVEENMQLELIDDHWRALTTIFREAREKGLLTDERWEEKAKAKTLTVSEAVYISLLLDHRRFRDFCDKE